MTRLEGMLTVDELKTLVSAGQIETVLVVFTDTYGRFLGKRFDADFFLDDALAHGAHACDYLLTVDMEMAPVAGYRFANWERGYGDFHLVPDLSTLRLATWLEKSAMVLCDVTDVKTGKPVAVAPRSMLRRQVDRAAEAGYTAMASSELEYYVFRDSFRDASKKSYAQLEPMGWYL
jgi:glutamine synthetase